MSNYSDSFLHALSFTLRWEGGYVNNPHDKGGATNLGITQAVYDSYRDSKHLPRVSVRYLDDDQMKEIYFVRYWQAAHCHSYPQDIAIALFDFAVNSGVDRAVRYLHAVGNNCTAYIDQREAFLRSIAKGNNSVFLKGWLNRINSLRSFIKSI